MTDAIRIRSAKRMSCSSVVRDAAASLPRAEPSNAFVRLRVTSAATAARAYRLLLPGAEVLHARSNERGGRRRLRRLSGVFHRVVAFVGSRQLRGYGEPRQSHLRLRALVARAAGVRIRRDVESDERAPRRDRAVRSRARQVRRTPDANQ